MRISKSNVLLSSLEREKHSQTTKQDMGSVSFATTASTSASTVASTSASTSASTTASTSASTTASTTSSSTASTTASTTASNNTMTDVFEKCKASLQKKDIPEIMEKAITAGGIALGLVGIVSTIVKSGNINPIKSFLGLKNVSNDQILNICDKSSKCIKTAIVGFAMLWQGIKEHFAIGRSADLDTLDTKIVKETLLKAYNNGCKEHSISDKNSPKIEVSYKDKLYTIENGQVSSSRLPRGYERLNEKMYGSYDTETHKIKISADNCKNEWRLSRTISHELYHSKEAIIRNSIPQAEREKIVKEVLIDNVFKGDNEFVIISYDRETFDETVMPYPQYSPAQRRILAKVAKEHLFAEDDSLARKMEDYCQLKYSEKSLTTKQEQKLKQLNIELTNILSPIKKLSSVSHFVKDETLRQKLSLAQEHTLLQYLISVENRYQYFKRNDHPFEQKELSWFDKKVLYKSFKSNIQSVEGNVALKQYSSYPNNSPIKKMAESAYRHSPEEYSAEMDAINQRISQLSTFENIFDEDIQKEIRSLKRERKIIKKENNRNRKMKEARDNPHKPTSLYWNIQYLKEFTRQNKDVLVSARTAVESVKHIFS